AAADADHRGVRQHRSQPVRDPGQPPGNQSALCRLAGKGVVAALEFFIELYPLRAFELAADRSVRAERGVSQPVLPQPLMRAPTDQRQSFRQWLAGSQHPAAAGVRAARGMLRNFTLPAPRLLVLPYLWLFLALRWAVFAFRRLLVAEPLFKAYCTRVGRGVTTGIYVPWIQGKGELLVGDGVHVSGKLSINYAARFCKRPRLEIGDGTDIAHDCRIVVGKEVV